MSFQAFQVAVDPDLLVETLSEFARSLASGFAIGDVLADLVERARLLLGVDGAGVSVEESDRLCFVTGVDEKAVTLERAQERAQAGPCVEAWRSGTVVVVEDLRNEGARWGTYTAVALRLGVVAVAATPMHLDGHGIGALDLYSDEPRHWSSDELSVAGVLADMATSYLGQATELERQRRVNGQLQAALESRVVIEQAKGMLSVERSVSVDEAFELLRAHARRHHASLRNVAEAVVRLGLRL